MNFVVIVEVVTVGDSLISSQLFWCKAYPSKAQYFYFLLDQHLHFIIIPYTIAEEFMLLKNNVLVLKLYSPLLIKLELSDIMLKDLLTLLIECFALTAYLSALFTTTFLDPFKIFTSIVENR